MIVPAISDQRGARARADVEGAAIGRVTVAELNQRGRGILDEDVVALLQPVAINRQGADSPARDESCD